MAYEIAPNIKSTLEALKRHKFDARLAETKAEAGALIREMIPVAAVVGIGDSVTLRQIGVIEELAKRGNRVINPFTREMTASPDKRRNFTRACREALLSDVFLTGCNAVTEDGKILSIDYAGNRVAGMIFGGEKVILAVGRNKITKDINDALYRVKNVITPVHAKAKGFKTPCAAAAGKCSDCESPDKICGVTVILERKLAHFEYCVILINEDLGLGWDPAWDKSRIASIEVAYHACSWDFKGMKKE